MNKRTFFFLLWLPAFGLQAQVDLPAAMKALQTARPGDTITVANGTYRDVPIHFLFHGDSLKPVVIRAEKPGGVVVSGASVLRLAGVGIEVRGFSFLNGYAPAGAVIEYRLGNEVANHCRITDCAIYHYNPPNRETENAWVLLYGRNNRFDHNSVVGKLNQGVTLAVILNEERHLNNHHSIDHNYFGERPVLASNGGETIRVGTSQSSRHSSRTQINDNLFERCNGEVEIISIKSCDNLIRRNTFLECAGVLALRHGDRNVVEENNFIGNNKPNTGGVRIINEGHVIRNNYFQNLTGNRFFSALAVMNAVPNSLPNRYSQVRDVVIEGNTWMDCANIQFCVGADNERTLPPANVLVKDNFFLNPTKNDVYTAYDDMSGFRFVNNGVSTKNGRFAQPGFRELTNTSRLRKPAFISPGSFGCRWLGGPDGERTAPSLPARQKRTVWPGQNTLTDAVSRANRGDTIELAKEGEYLLDNGVEIGTQLRIQAAPGLRTKPVLRYNGGKARAAVFTIADNGLLELDGLAFNHEAFDGQATAAAAMAPAPVMRTHYSVLVNDCEFFQFQESSFAAFKAHKGTYADTLRFRNCLFRDMSGDAISLAAEKQDDGKYNAEYVEVTNCAFYKVLGYAVDLYRGGSDESTTGPALVVDHCVLEDVNNKERGAGMRLYGVQNATVRNTVFSNTGRGGASLRFDETHWDKIAVTHCNLYNAGRIFSFWGKAVTGPLYHIKPSYQSIAAHDFRLQRASPLLNKATDGGAVGLAYDNHPINPTKTLTKK